MSRYQCNGVAFQLFSHLPSDIIAHLCQFMRLEEKCLIFPHLSRSIASLCNPSLCCRTDTTILNLREPVDINANAYKKISYFRYVQTVIIHLSDHLNFSTQAHDPDNIALRQAHQAIGSVLQHAFVNPALTSLYIDECCQLVASNSMSSHLRTTTLSVFILNNVLANISRMINIRQLKLIWQNSINEPVSSSIPLPIEGLQSCKHLHSLSLIPNHRYRWTSRSFELLPPSITHLVISDITHELCNSFLNPTFLPQLRKFEVVGLNYIDLKALATTEIVGTQSIRPIETLYQGLLSDVADFIAFSNIINIKLNMKTNMVSAFSDLPQGYLPHLRRVEIDLIGPASPVDPNPLITFLCVPNLRAFRLSSDSGELKMFTDHSIRLLASSHRLRSLEFLFYTYALLFPQDDVSHLIPPRSWPELHTLSLTGTLASADHLDVLLAAAPELRDAYFQCVSIDPIMPVNLLCSIATHCKKIMLVEYEIGNDVPHNDPTLYVDIDSVREAMQHFPNDALQNLFMLDIIQSFTTRAMHFFLSKLSSLPRLQYVMFTQEEYSARRLFLSMQRILPHLRQPFHYRYLQMPTDELGMFFRRECAPTQPLLFELDLEEEDLTEDRILGETFGWNCVYPVFYEKKDSHGTNGREAYSELLENSLSDEHFAILQDWDEGNYQWKA